MEKGIGESHKYAFTDILKWKCLHHQEKTKVFYRIFKPAGVNLRIFTKLPPASSFLGHTPLGLDLQVLPLHVYIIYSRVEVGV